MNVKPERLVLLQLDKRPCACIKMAFPCYLHVEVQPCAAGERPESTCHNLRPRTSPPVNSPASFCHCLILHCLNLLPVEATASSSPVQASLPSWLSLPPPQPCASLLLPPCQQPQLCSPPCNLCICVLVWLDKKGEFLPRHSAG